MAKSNCNRLSHQETPCACTCLKLPVHFANAVPDCSQFSTISLIIYAFCTALNITIIYCCNFVHSVVHVVLLNCIDIRIWSVIEYEYISYYLDIDPDNMGIDIY